MLWFDGPIRNAVDKVKSSGCILLVFVQGDDSLSEEYDTYLTKETEFDPDDYVAVKIPQKSVAFQQFKQIYVSVPVPSVFLLGNNGIPLNVLSCSKVSNIGSEITDALKKKKTKEEKKTKVQYNGEIIKNNKEIKTKPTQHMKNIDALELYRHLHFEDFRRLRSVDCKKVIFDFPGRKIFDISEEELKKRMKEIRAFPKFLLIETKSSTASTSLSSSSLKQKSARIQFRLPNNSMPSWEFPDLSTLTDVRAYVTEKLQLSSNFKLLRTYPNTVFSPEDEKKTLSELSLTPSATLIVVPVEDKTVQAKVADLLIQKNLFSAILTTLLQPLIFVFNSFKRFFLKKPNKEEKKPTRLPSDTEIEKMFNKKTSTSNIHELKFNKDPDSDTENPDNGNSTQQRYQK